MKKIVIGRGHDCDIIIEDTTDVVSRRQIAIAFDFLGRMTLYDLSTNGTYVNGVRVPKPSGVSVKYGDSVNFGNVCDFDLKRVKDPYRNLRIILGVTACVIILGIAAAVMLSRQSGPDLPPTTAPDDSVRVERNDSVPATVEVTEEPDEPDAVEIPEPKVSTRKRVAPKPENSNPSGHKTKTSGSNDESPEAPTVDLSSQKNT